MRLILLALGTAAAALAALIWASTRDLREPWVIPPMPDPMAGIQPADPVTVTVHHHPTCNSGCFDGWHHLGPEAGPYAVAYPIAGT